MKKSIAIIVAVLAVAAGVIYWTSFKNLYNKAEILGQSLANNSVVNQLKQVISTPPPLRGSENNPNAKLTQYGVISLTNAQRQQDGLVPLVENSKLDQAAALKLQDMFAKQYFEHVSPSGVGPAELAKQVGYQYISVGENLALGNFADDQALIIAWMNSPGHRANILNTGYTQIGVAVGKGEFQGHATWLAVQEFGRPASDCPAVDANLKNQIDTLTVQVQNQQQDLDKRKAELDSLPLKTKSDYDTYNTQAAAYNRAVQAYNADLANLKNLINQYNNQANAFNACAGG